MARRVVAVDEKTLTDCMEQLQEGYVHAVAATAGCLVNPIRRDTYGFDVLLVRPAEPGVQEVSVYAQLKSTTTVKPDVTKDSFSYQLKKREYFLQLATPRRDPKAILLVMVTSPRQHEWTTGDHEALSVNHCCYWVSIEGLKAPGGIESPTVRIPTDQVFDAAALTTILDKLDRGEPLRD